MQARGTENIFLKNKIKNNPITIQRNDRGHVFVCMSSNKTHTLLTAACNVMQFFVFFFYFFVNRALSSVTFTF